MNVQTREEVAGSIEPQGEEQEKSKQRVVETNELMAF